MVVAIFCAREAPRRYTRSIRRERTAKPNNLTIHVWFISPHCQSCTSPANIHGFRSLYPLTGLYPTCRGGSGGEASKLTLSEAAPPTVTSHTARGQQITCKSSAIPATAHTYIFLIIPPHIPLPALSLICTEHGVYTPNCSETNMAEDTFSSSDRALKEVTTSSNANGGKKKGGALPDVILPAHNPAPLDTLQAPFGQQYCASSPRNHAFTQGTDLLGPKIHDGKLRNLCGRRPFAQAVRVGLTLIFGVYHNNRPRAPASLHQQHPQHYTCTRLVSAPVPQR